MFLLNALKHHLPSIVAFIARNRNKDYSKGLSLIGNSLMDLYIGHLDIADITDEITEYLKSEGVDKKPAYIEWIQEKGFQKLSISDGSEWILLIGDAPEKYVHLHPARYSPNSLRIKATTLKTAISFLIERPLEKPNTQTLNVVRQKIGLSPIKNLADSQHLMALIELIRSR